MVPKNRPPVECGRVRVVFIAWGDLERMPLSTFNTPSGYIKYSTPEVTALELVGYPQHAGGLNNIPTVLEELCEEMTPGRLIEAAKLNPVGWSQRLGYLLDLANEKGLADALLPFVTENVNSYIPLRRSEDVTGASRNARWKVIVNADVEPDQ